MKVTRKVRLAIAATAAAGLVAGLVGPAQAAPKTTVSIVQSNALTGLNPSVTNMNLTFNVDVAYLSGVGFNYYNNKATLIDNTVLGTYKVVSQKPFKVQYKVQIVLLTFLRHCDPKKPGIAAWKNRVRVASEKVRAAEEDKRLQ
ncbi:MAG: hypothetical protein EB045_04580, partial [Actinobacteria bacterium]|nr:hypothetical protein [Actinomycetota bacterium]